MPVEIKDAPRFVQHRYVKPGGQPVKPSEVPDGALCIQADSRWHTWDGNLFYRKGGTFHDLNNLCSSWDEYSDVKFIVLRSTDAVTLLVK